MTFRDVPPVRAEAQVRVGAARARTADERDDLARLCAVLANPGRLAIVRALLDGERSAGALAKATRASPSATANRLRELENAGLLEVRDDRRRRIFRLKHPETARTVQRMEALAAAAAASVER